MTQEDKELLLKYLCAALPYHVFVHSCAGNDYELREVNVYIGSFGGTCAIPIPYLRSMSSMTEEEKAELFQLMGNGNDIQRIDFYLSHHFDFRGLIPKGLAIEVTQENNPYKN